MGFLTTKTEIMLPNSHSKSYKKKNTKGKKKKERRHMNEPYDISEKKEVAFQFVAGIES